MAQMSNIAMKVTIDPEWLTRFEAAVKASVEAVDRLKEIAMNVTIHPEWLARFDAAVDGSAEAVDRLKEIFDTPASITVERV